MIRKIIIVVTVFSLFMCFGCNEVRLPESKFADNLWSNGLTFKASAIEMYEAYLYADNNKILILALVASVFSSLLLFYQLTQRHKKERLLDTYAAETRLSRKVHDEIANEIYGTLHFLENEEVISGSKKEKLIAQLDNIYLLTRNISRENNDIDIGLRFPVQLKLMLGSYSNPEVNVIIKGISKIQWERIEPTKKINVYRVLQELMVNMNKHSSATVVLIDFRIERKKIKIIYSDNGVGIRCNTLNLKNGLRNVENRIVTIGGTVTFDTRAEKGFHLELNFTGS
jgi:signal transduction histidine kinase